MQNLKYHNIIKILEFWYQFLRIAEAKAYNQELTQSNTKPNETHDLRGSETKLLCPRVVAEYFIQILQQDYKVFSLKYSSLDGVGNTNTGKFTINMEDHHCTGNSPLHLRLVCSMRETKSHLE